MSQSEAKTEGHPPSSSLRADDLPPHARLAEGRHLLLERLSAGPFATVWRGHDELLDRATAVKIIDNDRADAAELTAQLRREVKTTQAFNHPHIVEIYDHGYDADMGQYAVMPLLTGATLATRLADGPPLSIEQIFAIAQQTADALEALHSGHVLHRDIKPENIFISTDDRTATGIHVHVLDLGVSTKWRPGSEVLASVDGTPYTMSPEQIRGHPLDNRSDIYALGVVLFELLTGHHPFNPTSTDELLRMHVVLTAPRADEIQGAQWLPTEAVDLLASMLEKDPSGRPDTMRVVLSMLQATKTAVTLAKSQVFVANAGGGTPMAQDHVAGQDAPREATRQSRSSSKEKL